MSQAIPDTFNPGTQSEGRAERHWRRVEKKPQVGRLTDDKLGNERRVVETR
jgi:hypothetical protein